MTDDSVTWWRNESIKHIATIAGPGAGIFTIIGMLAWGEVSKNSCLLSRPADGPCVPHKDVLGFHITSAEQFGLFIAISCLIGCLALMALTALTNKPNR